MIFDMSRTYSVRPEPVERLLAGGTLASTGSAQTGGGRTSFDRLSPNGSEEASEPGRSSGSLAPDFGGNADLQLHTLYQKLHFALAFPLVHIQPIGQHYPRGQLLGVAEPDGIDGAALVQKFE